MKTYKQIIGNKIFRYFYDTNIKLWTVHEVDKYGYQLSNEGDYYQNKIQMLKYYKFNFKTIY